MNQQYGPRARREGVTPQFTALHRRWNIKVRHFYQEQYIFDIDATTFLVANIGR